MSYYTNHDDLNDEEFEALTEDEKSFIEIGDYDLHALYNEYLNEAYGDAEIAGMVYSTSRALAEIDPTAYRTGFSDWLDSEIRLVNIVEA